MSASMIGVVPILYFSGAAGSNSVLEVAELPEVDPFAFVVDRGQPTLIFCHPVNAADPRGVVSLAARVAGVFGLRHRPQVLDPVVVADAVDVVDEVWVGTTHEFPDDAMRDPDYAVGADADVPFGVEASCGFPREDFVPRHVVGAWVPEQLPRGRVMSENLPQFGLRWQGVSVHSSSPCDMGTSVIDQMGSVKGPVCR